MIPPAAHPITIHIVIVTYGQYVLTDACVRSVLASSYPNIQLWLIDNGSPQQEYAAFFAMHAADSRIRCIRLEKNRGFGGGCNAALEQIVDGYVVFLNNDTTVDPGWLEPMVEYMEFHPDVGACQPKILNQRDPGYFEYAGAAGGFMDVYGYPFSRGRIFYNVEVDHGQYDTIVDIAWCSGTAMMTRCDVLDRVGVFDTIFFMYGEEADLCWRINHAGYRLVCIPQSRIYHIGGATMTKSPSYRKVFYLHRNGLIVLLKNYTVAEWFRYVSVRILFDGIAMVYYFVRHPFQLNWIVVLVAYAHLIVMMPRILRRHFAIRETRLHNPVRLPPLYRKSIVVDYFFRQKKYFSDLDQRFIR